MSARPARLILAPLLLAAASAFGGAQKYEPLSAAVRAQLHESVADTASPRLAAVSEQEGAAWLAEMSKRLQRYVQDPRSREDLLVTVQYEATRAGLDPQLVLGLIEIESKFRKYAVSAAGARGYMQVMPFWVRQIGEPGQNLFNLRTNLRYGCVVLRHYLDVERGDLFRALGRYNGTLGNATYPNRVLRAWARNWGYGDSRPAVSRAELETAPVKNKAPRVYWDN